MGSSNCCHRIVAENENDVEVEIKLAKEIKEKYCDKQGNETNPTEAAKIFHKIGLIYRQRSPDKIALIKSAGLFNEAILRNPSNLPQIKLALSELCHHILQLANAKIQNVDLIKKSKDVKISVTKLRQEVEQYLETNIPKISRLEAKPQINEMKKQKISSMKQLNKMIAQSYKQIMSELSQFCEDVLGKPPCIYAIVGMGSLARDESTPYSDFEHIILLCNQNSSESYLEYFRWFSVIFHIIILKVQETILPSLHIYSLNDNESDLGDWFYDAITPRGMSFDGLMPHASKNPLGRQQHTKSKAFTTELIKPVNEMLQYLSSASDLKHGYHLADILTKTCFVFGNEELHKQFLVGVQKYQNTRSETDTIKDIQKQVKEDLCSFSTRFRLTNFKTQSTINIKQLVYRSTTIFISALARKHKISANSSFEIIEELANTNKITQNVANKLQYAIAIACEMRLRVYTKTKAQCDNVVVSNQDDIKNFLDIVGEASTINYFQIAYCLQYEVAKQINFTKLHFYTDSQLINVSISLAFGLEGFKKISEDLQKWNWRLNQFDFDACIEDLETANDLTSNPVDNAHLSNPDTKFIKSIANHLLSTGIYDEALDFYQQLLYIYNIKPENNHDYDIAWVCCKIGSCMHSMNRNDKALIYYEQAFAIKQNISRRPDRDRSIATMLYKIGVCHINLDNYNEALTKLYLALEIEENITIDPNSDKLIADILHAIGRCHTDLHNHKEALTMLNRALEIVQNTTLDPDSSNSMAIVLNDIGRCHIDMHNYYKALTKLNRALEIKQNITLDPDTDRSIAITLDSIGRCHIALKKYYEALAKLNQAFEIKHKTVLDLDSDRSIAVTISLIGHCHIGLHNYDEELTKLLNQAFEIFQNTTLDPGTDLSIAKILHLLGRCHIGLHNYDEALKMLNRAFEFKHDTTLNPDSYDDIVAILAAIACCYLCLHNYDEALQKLNRALEIKQTTTLDFDSDRSIATIFELISRCLLVCITTMKH